MILLLIFISKFIELLSVLMMSTGWSGRSPESSLSPCDHCGRVCRQRAVAAAASKGRPPPSLPGVSHPARLLSFSAGRGGSPAGKSASLAGLPVPPSLGLLIIGVPFAPPRPSHQHHNPPFSPNTQTLNLSLLLTQIPTHSEL